MAAGPHGQNVFSVQMGNVNSLEYATVPHHHPSKEVLSSMIVFQHNANPLAAKESAVNGAPGQYAARSLAQIGRVWGKSVEKQNRTIQI